MAKITLDKVSVRVKDRNGKTKALFPSVEKFINFVTGSQEEGWWANQGERCNICKQTYLGLAADCRCTKYGYRSWRNVPRTLRPWYWKWIP